VNFVYNARGRFAYVTVGALNVVKVFDTGNFALVATIPVGDLPHGIWPSGDGSRVYVGLENGDALVAIDTMTNRVVATIPIGQAPQAVNYVPEAVPEGAGRQGLQALGVAGRAAHLALATIGIASGGRTVGSVPTTIALFDQGLTEVLEASVSGLEPAKNYVLALSARADGGGVLEPLAEFVTNPAGAAIVNAIGPIRRIVRDATDNQRRFLVVSPSENGRIGAAVQLQRSDSD
jgi:YVTN family beta-propeller protein